MGNLKRQGDVMRIARQGLLATVVILCALVASAHCQTDGITLLLQQSPFEGGVITPGPGVHLFSAEEEVELTAVPKPGYQFVCWLGDVGDATSNRTMTFLNQPKVIVAVFERCAYEDVFGSGSGNNGAATTPEVGGGGTFSSGGGGGTTPDPNPDPDPKPDPDPDPVPEPITILLLGSGGLMLLRKRR